MNQTGSCHWVNVDLGKPSKHVLVVAVGSAACAVSKSAQREKPDRDVVFVYGNADDNSTAGWLQTDDGKPAPIKPAYEAIIVIGQLDCSATAQYMATVSRLLWSKTKKMVSIIALPAVWADDRHKATAAEAMAQVVKTSDIVITQCNDLIQTTYCTSPSKSLETMLTSLTRGNAFGKDCQAAWATPSQLVKALLLCYYSTEMTSYRNAIAIETVKDGEASPARDFVLENRAQPLTTFGIKRLMQRLLLAHQSKP